MDPVTEHVNIEANVLLTQRIAAKHPDYPSVCAELTRQMTRMRAFNAALKGLVEHTNAYDHAFDRFKDASWDVLTLNSTKVDMERSVLSDVAE